MAHFSSWPFRLVLTTTFCLLPVVAMATDNPYCGVYAVYGAAHALGNTEVDFAKFLDAKYVSSNAGSTDSDLICAANSVGLGATAFTSRSIATLVCAKPPLVLHVSADGRLFEHWVLFLGTNNGQAVVTAL